MKFWMIIRKMEELENQKGMDSVGTEIRIRKIKTNANFGII